MLITNKNCLERVYDADIIDGVLTIPEGVMYISRWACHNRSNLKKVILPKSVMQIGGRFANNCLNLEEIVMPENIFYVGSYFTEYCPSLKTIKIY